VLGTEGRLVEVWRQRGHPKASIVTRDVVADHRNDTVDVTLAVEPGPVATFAEPLIQGTERVDPAYARFMTGIRPGEPYDPDAIDRARKRLQDLGVFASVSVEEGASVGPDGVLPITFVLAERKRHLVGGGVSYSTIDGASLEAYWMHRNLFGHGESLRFDANASRILADGFDDISYELATTFRRPGVITPDTDVTLRVYAEREDVDPYVSTTIGATAGIEHRFNEKLTGATAVNVEWADIEDAFGNRDYLLISLPSELDYDGRDNTLDPTEGVRAILDIEPFADIKAGTLAVVSKGSLAGYYGFGKDDRVIVAGRGAVGTIVGGDTEDIPATRRFFLGGGGSIRGFEYRSVGPEVNGEVVGGLSFFETSLELRVRVTDTIGIVPFIDAGVAYEDPIPDFSEEVNVGAGIGIRYYTPLGPLRFDIAVPVMGESENDFAFYVGLGQAF
jgi:translocation and assembly module TamA